MTSKIEAAEEMARAIEGCADGQTLKAAAAIYRAASVPSDEELGRVAYDRFMDFDDNTESVWDAVARAVRDRLQGCEQPDAATVAASQAEPEFYVGLASAVVLEPDKLRERLKAGLLRAGYNLTEDELDAVASEVVNGGPLIEWFNDGATIGIRQGGQLVGGIYVSDGRLVAHVGGEVVSGPNWSITDAKAWCESKLLEGGE